MPGEIAHDDVICGPFKIYEIEIYNVIIDTATECMRRRFLTNHKLYADFACLDPRHFNEIKQKGLKALEELCKRLVNFDTRVTVDSLRSELTSLALHWDK